MHSRSSTMKRCCRGTAHQRCHGKRKAHLAVGVVHGSDTVPLGHLLMYHSPRIDRRLAVLSTAVSRLWAKNALAFELRSAQ